MAKGRHFVLIEGEKTKWDTYAKGATTTADERNVQSPVFFFCIFNTADNEEVVR